MCNLKYVHTLLKVPILRYCHKKHVYDRIEVHYHVHYKWGDDFERNESRGTVFDTRRFGPKGTFFSCIKKQILCKKLYHMIHYIQNHPPYLNTCMMHASMNGLLIQSAATQYIYSSTRLAPVHVCMYVCVCVRMQIQLLHPH